MMIEWIDVKDRLPEEGVSVIVLQEGNSVCNHLLLQASLFEGRWYADHMDANIDDGDALDVDFWYPLPKEYSF